MRDFKVNGLARRFSLTLDAGDSTSAWLVEGSYDVVDARLVVTQISIEAASSEIAQNGITGILLRKLSPAHVLDQVQTHEKGYVDFLKQGSAEADPDDHAESIRRIEAIADSTNELATAPRFGPTGLKGRPPLDAGFLREVSRIHIEERRRDGPYGSVQRLADRYGVPKETAKSWLKKAKDRGLHPDTTQPTDSEGE